jgi:hypothetical protein
VFFSLSVAPAHDPAKSRERVALVDLRVIRDEGATTPLVASRDCEEYRNASGDQQSTEGKLE